MEYAYLTSRDPKWQKVRPGQYAVAQTDAEGQILLVFTVEDTKQQAAYARSLNLNGTAVLYRDGEEEVQSIPWRQ
jgi:hypothetical protein